MKKVYDSVLEAYEKTKETVDIMVKEYPWLPGYKLYCSRDCSDCDSGSHDRRMIYRELMSAHFTIARVKNMINDYMKKNSKENPTS